MEIYIEYAVIENFLIDTALLTLAFYSSKTKTSVLFIISGGLIGSAFAVVFPLFKLNKIVMQLIKLPFGFVICYVALKEKLKKSYKRYFLTVLFFYSYSFAFGGILTAFSNTTLISNGGYYIEKLPVGTLFAVGVFFVLFTLKGIKAVYKRKNYVNSTYDCKIKRGEKEIKLKGFLDTGNTATVEGKPLNFITPDMIFDLFDDATANGETEITTLGGKKKVKYYVADEMQIYYGDKENIIKQVSLVPSQNLIGREYKLLLNVNSIKRE